MTATDCAVQAITQTEEKNPEEKMPSRWCGTSLTVGRFEALVPATIQWLSQDVLLGD